MHAGTNTPNLSPLSVGLVPFISAFIIVEIVVLLLRPSSRHGSPEFRHKMTQFSVGLGVVMAHTLGIVVGSCLHVAAAFFISRHGVGNGFAVLIASDILFKACLGAIGLASSEYDLGAVEVLLSVFSLAGLVSALVWFFRAKSPGPEGVHLRSPTRLQGPHRRGT